MKTFLYHVQINVGDPRAIAFYRELFAFLDYRVVVEAHDLLGVSNGATDFWMIARHRTAVPPASIERIRASITSASVCASVATWIASSRSS